MVKIGLEFNSIDEAIVALAKLTAGKKAAIVADTPLADPNERAARAIASSVPVVLPGSKAARKGRSDAGKPRGPRKESAAPASHEAQSGGDIPPVGAADPKAADPATPKQNTDSPAATGALDSAAPTLEDAQKKLEALFNAKGLLAALKVLETFGKKRVQDVPADKRAEFIVLVDKELV